ncbi:MAG: pilin [Pseudomonadota bacterium]|nr:pilin [Pseudomonadota bacterium]
MRTVNQQSGFTLIELIIGITILLLLTVIVMNTFRTYVIRSQIMEGLEITDNIKQLINKHHKIHGDLPLSHEDLDLSVETIMTSDNVKSIDIIDGSIILTFGNQSNPTISDAVITLIPKIMPKKNLSWSCGNRLETTVPQRYRPQYCR